MGKNGNVWGIKDFWKLYQITQNGANVEIVLILLSTYVEILLNILK